MEGWNEYSCIDRLTWPAHDEECECLVYRPKRYKKGQLEYEEVVVRGKFVRVDCGFGSEGGEFKLPEYDHPIWSCRFPANRVHVVHHNEQRVLGWRPVLNLN